MSDFEKIQIDRLLKERYLWQLRSPQMYKKSYEEVVAILDLHYWNDPKFSGLLCNQIWKRSYSEIVDIMDLHYDERPDVLVWDEEPMMKLLSPVMWNSSVEHIRKKVNLSIWQNAIYQPLLSIWVWKAPLERITDLVAEMKELRLTHYMSPAVLRTTPLKLKVLYRYIVGHRLGVIVHGKLNPILVEPSPAVLLRKYGINLEQLLEEERKREMRRALSK
ncbi:MAG: hypothetical protein K2M17_05855 [Bacilli bacterium]|nr:hypothetical protein [Bacilli bacterium]